MARPTRTAPPVTNATRFFGCDSAAGTTTEYRTTRRADAAGGSSLTRLEFLSKLRPERTIPLGPVSKLMSPSSTLPVDPRRRALEAAVTEWLRACGVDLEHKDFVGTPQRVAALWLSDVLTGYQADPAAILGDPVTGEAPTEFVVVRNIPCHGMCPHHLMPWMGQATVAYLPGTQLLGFGRLADLVHCFTRRLTLQERVCNDVADALMSHLDARGSACIIEGTHTCLTVPDDKHDARVVTSSYRGELRTRADLQGQLRGRA
ncbi:MAG: GTP cyclohydrolase I FolE [Myxococcales bacterium FL481]|nr:MAG: GTP cyclohydrolase I FolE [Myxococcales bacterium FL481]